MSLVGTDDVAGPDWVLAALRQHEQPLLRYAASLVGESRAQDVVQDAFLRLCSQSFESVADHLAAWLFTVCRNRALELRRAERRLSSMDDGDEDDARESPDSGPIEKVERAENVSRVRAAMAALPRRHREVLRLKLEADLSYKDIAAVMNLSVGNVGFILHTAIAKIREQLSEPLEAARAEGSAL
ncbi:MAG TPA: sigma-70 family RNA polymerase sigma factor [Polyangiaceae bacterium]|nr:sigma-70 family RNA polymerase sigma factor [Polyangiaceae bacterium]